MTINAKVAGNAYDAVNGVITFHSAAQNNRSALLYANGVVYIAFGSINDKPSCTTGATYYGWILGYNAFNIQQQVAVFNPSPAVAGNGSGPGGKDAIWGGALAASQTCAPRSKQSNLRGNRKWPVQWVSRRLWQHLPETFPRQQ